jgi:hypothetical protein
MNLKKRCCELRKSKTMNHRGTETQRESKTEKPEMAFAFPVFLCASVSLWFMVFWFFDSNEDFRDEE